MKRFFNSLYLQKKSGAIKKNEAFLKKNANNNLKRKPKIRLKYRKKPFNKHPFTQNDKKDLNEKEKKEL